MDMMTLLRKLAWEEAQKAFHEANEYRMKHGHGDPRLDARYVTAERIIDLIDERIESEQLADLAEHLADRMTDPGDHYAGMQS
jgi:hypothetical protein